MNMTLVGMQAAQLLVGGLVLWAALCRLGPMHVRRHKLQWLAVYLGFAAGAASAVYEVTQGTASWAAICWGAAAWLYLWGSRLSWAKGVPAYFERTEMRGRWIGENRDPRYPKPAAPPGPPRGLS